MGHTAGAGTPDGPQQEPRGDNRTLTRPPTFRQLGFNARDVLGVVSFFPQGVVPSFVDAPE